MPTMPWLLYRMMLVDLLRVIGLTAAVLVTVIAFGATIKPLTGDTVLDAGQVFKYLLLAIVPMLQFALPFAAGFGATIALHRMSVDNEVQAMAASGLSYRRILLPVLVLGLALCIVMIALTQEVIPRFWSLIERMIAKDVTRIFEASIRRGQPFALGDMQIYADDIIVQRSPEGADGPETRLQLAKVAAAELDESGRIVTDVTAPTEGRDAAETGDVRCGCLQVDDGRTRAAGAVQAVARHCDSRRPARRTQGQESRRTAGAARESRSLRPSD
jgi:lipopolysaccharide export system permease protein